MRRARVFLEAVVVEPVQQRIIVGVNRSKASVAALQWAAGEARLRHTTLHVVHAWEPPPRRASYALVGARSATGQERLQAGGDLAAVMRAAFGRDAPAGVTAELVEGVAERALVARSRGAALLVLGASGTDLAGRPAGPVIRACMRSTQCPLVIITTAVSERAPVPEPVPVS